MVRRSYSGNAPSTTLSGGITNSTLTIGLTSGVGYPSGSSGPFFIVIDPGLSAEEKVLCDSLTADTLTVNAAGRGVDGTSAASHSAGAVVQHVFTKTDADEANAHVNDVTTDVHPQYTTTAELATHAAAADPHTAYLTTAEVSALVTFEVPFTWTVAADVRVPVGDVDYLPGFFLPVLAGYTAKINRARHRINSGTSATVKIQIDGVDATGFTAMSVTTTSTTTNPTDVAVTDLQYIAPVVTAVSASPKNMSLTIIVQYTRS